MTPSLGSWLLPFAVTMIAWGWAIIKLPKHQTYRNPYERMGNDAVAVVRLAIALIISLIAWLAWAIGIILQAPK